MNDLEEWAPVIEFPLYIVSSFGRVANEKTGRILKESQTRTGLTKVGIIHDGVQYTRSVSLLVAIAFVPGKDDIFDTPIHLDNQPSNNYAHNLLWRPRWFAWKYKRQFSKSLIGNSKLSVLDIDTGQIYFNMLEAAMINGLLIEHIWRSVTRGIECFPTQQIFKLTS